MRPSRLLLLLLLALVLVGAAAAGGHDDAAARRIMEEFAGFPASGDGEGPRSTAFSVDSEGLQRQVRRLSPLVLCRAAGYRF
jgi:ureidoglycolate amidohydrolase